MNRRNALGTMVAVGAVTAAVAPMAMAADVEVDIWALRWQLSKDYTMKIADAMPADSYNYRPAGESSGDGTRNFAEVMQHIAQAEGFYIGRFGKGPAPAAPKDAAGKADLSKPATLKYLGDTMDYSIGVIKQLTAADMTKVFTAAKGNSPVVTGLDLLLNAMIHTAHTRGYSDMYLRNKGIKPPTYAVG